MANYELNQTYNYVNIDLLHRQIVPPAEVIEDRDRKTVAILEPGATFSLSTDSYGDRRFVEELSECQPLKLEPAISSWQYNHRNQAQEILPFLLLGPMAVARDVQYVQSNNITMLLAVRDGKAASKHPRIMDPNRFVSAAGIETGTFDVLDESDLIRRFRSIIKRMNDHLMAKTSQRPITRLSDIGGKVLVFCEAGDTRSAAVVVLYFMVVFGLSARGAIQAVQVRRYGINISGELHRMLQSFEDILQAEREVAADLVSRSESMNVYSIGARKRSFDSTEENIEEMNLARDDGKVHRTGTAPFKDMVL